MGYSFQSASTQPHLEVGHQDVVHAVGAAALLAAIIAIVLLRVGLVALRRLAHGEWAIQPETAAACAAAVSRRCTQRARARPLCRVKTQHSAACTARHLAFGSVGAHHGVGSALGAQVPQRHLPQPSVAAAGGALLDGGIPVKGRRASSGGFRGSECASAGKAVGGSEGQNVRVLDRQWGVQMVRMCQFWTGRGAQIALGGTGEGVAGGGQRACQAFIAATQQRSRRC